MHHKVAREVLEGAEVHYMTKTERKQFVVTTNSEGLLCWVNQGMKLVNTQKKVRAYRADPHHWEFVICFG